MNFTLARLLIAVSASAVSLRVFAKHGLAGGAVSLLIGLLVGLVCLYIQRDEIWATVRSGLFTILGAVVGMILSDASQNLYRTSLLEVLSCTVIGGVVGFAVGSLIPVLGSKPKEPPPRE
ncbi:hypothetical protein OAG68_01300 [bacterium]|nr:hypothetical protein [bacterium]